MSNVVNEALRVISGLKGTLAGNGWFISDAYSPNWWGGAQSPDEVVITAILVQQTKWSKVHDALIKLRAAGLNSLNALAQSNQNRLIDSLDGINFKVTKARRLIEIAKAIVNNGGINYLANLNNDDARDFLLSMSGIGPETADSIMLFALNKLSLPISSYTIRVMGRLMNINGEGSYMHWRSMLMRLLPQDLFSYKLFHAGIVTIGRVWCLKYKPRCNQCPLKGICGYDALTRLASMQDQAQLRHVS